MKYVCPQCQTVKDDEKELKLKCDKCEEDIIMLPTENGRLEYDCIHFNLFDPAKSIFKGHGNDRAEFQTIECCNHENCQLYERGQCSWRGAFGWYNCPYGKPNGGQGFTKRARKFRKWINEKKEQYADVPHLNGHSNMIASVGDYIFLPYSHMTLCKDVPFIRHGQAFSKGRPFLKKEDFSIDNVLKLVDFRPQAIIGGEIKKYRKEVVPLFLQHLMKFDPEMYEEICEKSEFAREVSQKLTNVGRKAKLRSIVPNVGVLKDIHGGEWVWDGEWMVCTNRDPSFMLVREVEEVRIKPKGDPEVKINEEDQVNADTVFVD